MYDELLNLNISGILSKDSSEEHLRNVVRCMMEGQTAIPVALFKQLRINKLEVEQETLTEQEIHIMSLIVEGHTHEQIGDSLFFSKRSIDNYLRKIYEKLGVQNKSQAIQKFTQCGLH
ncbi:response regulator transcription factor [Paenibacillus sp. SI8]|uniref:response regulator transcription factor n=1 Tax=unclassified Paenibacillus TaxID=185978 RepID=UPI0034662153